MQLKRKVTSDAQSKISPTGAVSFYASVFGNRDLVDDRVLKGAFADTLIAWRAKNDPVPIVWSHRWDEPGMIIGAADANDIVEDDIGLKVMGRLDIETNGVAKQVHSLMDRRIVTEASFAYDVRKQRKAKDGANDLLRLDLLEVGPTLKGMNPLTGSLPSAAKDAGLDIDLLTGDDLPKLIRELDIAEAKAFVKSVSGSHVTREEAARLINFLEWERELLTS